MFQVRCEEKKLKLEVEGLGDVPSPVHADEGKLRQTLINLLGNAVKFTERGSVTLRVSEKVSKRVSETGSAAQDSHSPTHALTHSRYQFEIIDTGKGISPE